MILNIEINFFNNPNVTYILYFSNLKRPFWICVHPCSISNVSTSRAKLKFKLKLTNIISIAQISPFLDL